MNFEKEVESTLAYGTDVVSRLEAEARAEGLAEGEIRGKVKGVIETLWKELNLSASQIANKLKLTEAEVSEVLRELKLQP